MLVIESIPANRVAGLPVREHIHNTPPPPELTPSYRKDSNNDDRQRHYRTVGETLLICEAASFRAGIPWLLPTRVVRDRAAGMDGTLADYLRQSLATANTHVIESYCEDLMNLPDEPVASEQLFIPAPTYAERYAFPSAASFVTFLATFLSGFIYLGQTVTLSAMAAALVSLFFLFVGLFLVDEKTRRESFHGLLRGEIARRSGAGGSTVPLQLMTPQVK